MLLPETLTDAQHSALVEVIRLLARRGRAVRADKQENAMPAENLGGDAAGIADDTHGRFVEKKGVRRMYTYSTAKHANSQSAPIHRSDGRIVGEVRDGVFQKHVRGSVHFLREPRAVGFDVSALRDAERAGAKSILIFDDETGAEYRTSFRHFWRKSFSVQRGHGDQRAMRLTEFNKPDEPDEPRAFLSKPTQPALFNLAPLVR